MRMLSDTVHRFHVIKVGRLYLTCWYNTDKRIKRPVTVPICYFKTKPKVGDNVCLFGNNYIRFCVQEHTKSIHRIMSLEHWSEYYKDKSMWEVLK